MQWACLVSPSVIYRRNPDSAPDPSSSGTVGATTIDFELSCKSSTGEGKTLTAFCGPLFIRPPEVAGPAPGAWVQLAAGVEELLKQLTLRCSAGRNVCRRRGFFQQVLCLPTTWNFAGVCLKGFAIFRPPVLLYQLSSKHARSDCFGMCVTQRMQADCVCLFGEGDGFTRVALPLAEQSKIMQDLCCICMLLFSCVLSAC